MHNYSTKQTKSAPTSESNALLLTSEISMNQNPSHSQTPKFDADKSQTSQRLYQHPTQEELEVKHPVLRRLADAAAGAVLIITVASITLMTVKGCSADVDRQEHAAIKHQLQFSASNGGTR